MVVLSSNILKGDASINMIFASTIKAPILSHFVRAHIYTNIKGRDFGTYTFLGPWGLAPFLTKQIYLQNLKHLFYHNKTLQSGPYVYNVYKCTHEHTLNHVCEHDEHVYAVYGVHAYVELVSFETWIPTVCGSWHFGSNLEPNTLL